MFDSSIIIYSMSFNQKCTQKQAAMKRYNLKIFDGGRVAKLNGQVPSSLYGDMVRWTLQCTTLRINFAMLLELIRGS